MRHDPNSNAGCINWPDNTTNEDTGEGGMWVYAYVLASDAEDHVQCCGPSSTLALPMPDVVVADPGNVYPDNCWSANRSDPHANCYAGYPIVAAILLGSTGGSWHNDSGYFACTNADLTDAGRDLLDKLGQLYGGAPVHLVTYLDT